MAATVKKTFDIALDIAASSSNRAFTVVEGDTGNVLCIALTDDGEPVDLTGCRVIAVFSKSNGTAAQDSQQADGGVHLEGALNNQVRIDLFPGSFAPGMVECELQIYSDETLNTLVTTAKFNFNCRPAMLSADAMESTGQLPMLRALMEQVEALETAATAAAQRAEDAAQACESLVEGHVTTFTILRYEDSATTA